ncbi:hypothetical protein [Nostoc sp. MG11]|uniref:hypothetical protein n=1 Tax=Nostoc sp. MG11 TaxID=2721166 RepID=UPI001866733F|nr:hypothetical protein [Nostoc sp. MG11]
MALHVGVALTSLREAVLTASSVTIAAIAFYNWSINSIYIYELSSPTPTKD